MLEKDYPYVALDESCQSDSTQSTGINVVKITSVLPNNVKKLKAAVAK